MQKFVIKDVHTDITYLHGNGFWNRTWHLLRSRLGQLTISKPWIFPCCCFIKIVDVITTKIEK
jgi:hypothetical protein